MSDYHVTPSVIPDNTAPEIWRLRALTICCEFFLSQLFVPLQQPASAAESRRVLQPDILEVSHLCGCMYWELVCAYLCLTFSLIQNYISRGRVKNNAFKQSCTTFCSLYFAPAPCTLIVTMALLACVYACWHNHKSNANRGSTILKHTSTQPVLNFAVTYVIFLKRADDRILLQLPVPWCQPSPFLSPNGAWTIQALTRLSRVRRTFTLQVPRGFPCWLRANTGLSTCVDLRAPLSLAIAFSVSTLLVCSRETARVRQNLAVWACPAWASKR